MLNSSGILGSVATSLILTFATNLNLLYATRVCILLSLTVFCGLIPVLFFVNYDSQWPCYLMNSLLGFTLVPLFFISYELASQQTKKLGVGEATSCGIINMIANGFSFIEVLSLTPFLKHAT